MMSIPDKVVPFSPAPSATPSRGTLELTRLPGLSPEAIRGLEILYPGILTHAMRSLLRASCGVEAGKFGAIDFTSLCHPEEPLSVFRPCITLAIDDEGCRWVAETSRAQGLPGPVWCVLREPAVAVYASCDLEGFLSTLEEKGHQGRLSKWIRRLHQEAWMVWTCRHTLAWESYHRCRQEPGLRGWLAELPFDTRIYDLRTKSALRGWPYGLAGPEGRLHRCGHLPIFAVSPSSSVNRRAEWTTQSPASYEIPVPAIASSSAA